MLEVIARRRCLLKWLHGDLTCTTLAHCCLHLLLYGKSLAAAINERAGPKSPCIKLSVKRVDELSEPERTFTTTKGHRGQNEPDKHKSADCQRLDWGSQLGTCKMHLASIGWLCPFCPLRERKQYLKPRLSLSDFCLS